MRIDGIDVPAQTQAARPRARAGRFTLPDAEEASPPCEPSATGAAAAVSFATDWTGADDAVADREAGRHGRAMLDALRGLQLAQLGGDPDASLAELARLAEARPQAGDPRLQSVIDAVAVRVAVELARRQ